MSGEIDPLSQMTADGVTIADLLRFFNDKRISSICPVCKGDAFDIATAPEGWRWAVTGTIPEQQNQPQIPLLPSTIVVCRSCGYMRSHASKIVVDWLRANPKEGDQ